MPWPPEKRRPQPGANGCGPQKNFAIGNSDNSNPKLEIALSQLQHRPIGPGELAALRALWWRQASAGHRLPAEIGVIAIEGGVI